MRALNSGSAARALGLLTLCAVVGSGSADVGGGRGQPATPWRISGPANVAELEKAREEAAHRQALSLPSALFAEAGSEAVKIEEVALRPVPAKADETGVFEFVGKDAAGKKLSLSFSNLENFVVTAKTDVAVTLKVTIWPDISPAELLARQPTYQELKESFRREVTIEIPLKAADGRALEFSGDFGLKLPLVKLAVGTKGDFYGGDPRMVNPRRFWWAIPSVNKDPDYPFRMIFRN